MSNVLLLFKYTKANINFFPIPLDSEIYSWRGKVFNAGFGSCLMGKEV